MILALHTCHISLPEAPGGRPTTTTMTVAHRFHILRLLFLPALLSVAAAQSADFWNNQAQDTLRATLAQQENLGVAKNVIFFLGDGMDITTTTAARIFSGQQAGNTGEENRLVWDDFPHVALSQTYNTNQQSSDSAGTATAFLTGVKTKAGVVGVDDRIERGDCDSMTGAELNSLLVQAAQAGKATGIVTTTRVTHATPSASYAHSPDRNWETDVDIPSEEAAKGCIDIARQLLQQNSFIDVILGGGRGNFLPNTTTDPEDGSMGKRTDGLNLIEQWLADQGPTARYVWNSTGFQEAAQDITSIEKLLGLFQPSHMQYESDRANDTAGEPSIAEMTEMAINMLQRNTGGYFLLVEGGRIDHGHHAGVGRDALVDTVALHEAVLKALAMTDPSDTLIIVTADHAHVFTFGGYASRGNPILGYDDSSNGTDGLPYLSLMYANGPGAYRFTESLNKTGKRPNPLNLDYTGKKFLQDAAVPVEEETHGGSDVAIYAHGPWAHLFHGTQEQNYIAHAVRYAACYLNTEENACTRPTTTPLPCSGTGRSHNGGLARILAWAGAVAALLIMWGKLF